jgi:pyrimidine operon attenuation protein/uracil phosphoribosyltransferase
MSKESSAIERHQILDRPAIESRVRRIAWQIYEEHLDEDELVLVGIEPIGTRFMELLHDKLREISLQKFTLLRMEVAKKAQTQPEIQIANIEACDGRAVVIVDDVLNSGRTLAFALSPFLERPLKKLAVAVLVDRGYTAFPVKADYVGYALSTTIQEHIRVYLSEDQFGAWLH